MRKFKILLALMLVFTAGAFADDSYDKLAGELAKSGSGIKKLAIIPFSYAENTASTKDGAVISERLTMKLINLQKFEIIERSVLDKVLNELKLQNSGTIDATSAKELGKVLGVDAIVTGTLVSTMDGKIEVNARLIKTETAQAIGASQVYVSKDWLGGDVQQQPVQQQPQPVQQQYVQSQPEQKPFYAQKQAAPAQTYVRGEFEYGFFDVLMGFGSQTTDIKWDPAKSGNLEFKAMATNGAGPIGLRVGGFGKGIVGGDFEFSVSKHYVQKQTIVVNGFPFSVPDGYINATSFGMSGDLLLRTMTKAQLYFGLGLGLSINNIQSTSIPDAYGKYLNETDIGFMFRVPIGVRFNMDSTTFFMEYRAEISGTSFTRSVANESNSLTFTGSRFVLGIGSKF